jgi:hypothetical protein
MTTDVIFALSELTSVRKWRSVAEPGCSACAEIPLDVAHHSGMISHTIP